MGRTNNAAATQIAETSWPASASGPTPASPAWVHVTCCWDTGSLRTRDLKSASHMINSWHEMMNEKLEAVRRLKLLCVPCIGGQLKETKTEPFGQPSSPNPKGDPIVLLLAFYCTCPCRKPCELSNILISLPVVRCWMPVANLC